MEVVEGDLFEHRFGFPVAPLDSVEVPPVVPVPETQTQAGRLIAVSAKGRRLTATTIHELPLVGYPLCSRCPADPIGQVTIEDSRTVTRSDDRTVADAGIDQFAGGLDGDETGIAGDGSITGGVDRPHQPDLLRPSEQDAEMTKLGVSAASVKGGQGSGDSGEVIASRCTEASTWGTALGHPEHGDVAGLDGSVGGEPQLTGLALGVVADDSPPGPVRLRNDLDLGILEIGGSDPSPELERSVLTVDPCDDEGRMIHVGYREEQRVLLPALLGDEEIAAGVVIELQIVTSAHPPFDPGDHFVLDARCGGKMGQLIQPLLGRRPISHLSPFCEDSRRSLRHGSSQNG